MNEIHLYGLTGYPLSHSFSQKYFTEKFEREGYKGYFYIMLPTDNISELHNLPDKYPDLCGFNVTIPYKEKIIPFIDTLDSIAAETGAVNTVCVVRGSSDILLKGYNTDVYGFRRSLEEWYAALDAELPRQALVLGSGGASKAVVYALHCLGMVANTVSRNESAGIYKTYEQINATDIAAHLLIVNTTPLGMFPDIDRCPAVPYQYLTPRHCLYDLVYNPEETLFMRKGLEKGASAKNGLRMLHLQADKAWEIWTENGCISNVSSE
jgi:shikimate dehydrogenase